jgi:hypothetical protein
MRMAELHDCGKYLTGGKFVSWRAHSVGRCRNYVEQSDLYEILESTWGSIGASAESCIKFENVLLVRVGIPWLKDVGINGEFRPRTLLVCGSMNSSSGKEVVSLRF